MKRTFQLHALFLTLTLFICVKSTWAEQVAVSLKPGVTEITAKPGITTQQTVTIVNSGDPGVFTLRIYEADSVDLHGNISLSPIKHQEIRFHLDNQQVQLGVPFLLDANGKQEFQLGIEVSKGAPEEFKQKEYIYTLIAESEKPLPIEGTVNTRISTGIGSTFIVQVLPENVSQISVVPLIFKIARGITIPMGNSRLTILDSNTPIPFIYQLKNKGDYSVRAHSKLVLKNMVSKSQRAFSFLPTNLYPNADRLIPIDHFDMGACEKAFNARNCDASYSGILPSSVFGLYEASIKTTFGRESPMLYSSDIFIVVPYFLVGFVAISIGIALLLLIRMWRHHLREAPPAKQQTHRILQ